MVLNFGGGGLFGKSGGLLKDPKFAASIIVAKDGSGDTDDPREAVSLLPAEGGTIVIKPGTYWIDTDIEVDRSNVSIIGSGNATTIQTTTDINVIHVQNAKNRCLIADLNIVGDLVGGNQYGIFVEGNNCTIRNVELVNLKTKAIWITGDEARVFNCVISMTGGKGIHAETGSDHIINGNFIEGCFDGIESDCDDIIISNNLLSTNSTGIDVKDNDFVTVTDNNVSTGTNCISLSGTKRSVITGNVCNNGTGSGIQTVGDTDFNVINCNSCHTNGAYGINVNVGGDSNAIVGNCCKNNSTANLRDAGAGNTTANNEV